MLYQTPHHHHHHHLHQPRNAFITLSPSSSSSKYPCLPTPRAIAPTTTVHQHSSAATSVSKVITDMECCVGVHYGTRTTGFPRPEYSSNFSLRHLQGQQNPPPPPPLPQQQQQQQEQAHKSELRLGEEEILFSNGANIGVSSEDLCFVDEFLNFAMEEEEEEEFDAAALSAALLEEELKLKKETYDCGPICHSPSAPLLPPPIQQQQQQQPNKEEEKSMKEEENPNPATTSDPADDFGSVLTVPAEEKDLEWLSHFVEESFNEFSTPYPPGFIPQKPITAFKSKSDPEKQQNPAAPFLTKARRSKRVRADSRMWAFNSYESTTRSTTTTTTSSGCSSYSNSPPSPTSTYFSVEKPASQQPAAKKAKKGGGGGGGEYGSGSHGATARKCSHCGVQKTPQWRTGPNGAKTLCNACGVRYKSGRLLPEYRPACSPTFSSELHSNNHRKVLEMRNKKQGNDMDDNNNNMVADLAAVGGTITEPESAEHGLATPVPSFG